MSGFVLLDQRHTWPRAMARFVTATCDWLRKEERIESEFAGDLWRLDLEGELEREFRRTLDGHQVVCYHATRLLRHEVEEIPRAGLHVLSDELRARKLAAARSHHPDVVSEDDVQLLLDNGPLSWQGTDGARNGTLCFVTPWTAVVGERNGLSYLFGRWGGEAIGWTNGCQRPTCCPRVWPSAVLAGGHEKSSR